MIPVFTSEEIRSCDVQAIRSYGVPGILLMENAARGATEFFLELLTPPTDSLVTIVCGRGNNGGDGFAIARHLLNRGFAVRVILLRHDDVITGDARVNLDILRAVERETERLTISLLNTTDELSLLVSGSSFLVDAILGTGLSASLSDEYARAVEAMNVSGIPIAAVDVPTGIDSDSGEIMGTAIRAFCTATMGGLKRGLLFDDGRECAGVVRVIDIGMPKQGFYEDATRTFLLERFDIRQWLPNRPANAHKYSVGSVFVLGGSRGLTGAAALSSEAALRTGAGIVKLGIPASLNAILEMKLTEVMTVPLADDGGGTFALQAQVDALPYMNAADTCVVGPGFSRHEEALEVAREIVAAVESPLIIDADALFALAGNQRLLKVRESSTVLTPHEGEFARMLGTSRDDVRANRFEYVRAFAAEFSVTVVLKGAPTIVAWPNGPIFINSTGNAGMATAGSGDVLSGMIAALVCQGVPSQEAACAGVYLHGLAGDFARGSKGQFAMIASDILANLPGAFAHCASV